LGPDGKTNNEVYKFCLLQGFSPQKANEVLGDMQKADQITTLTFPDGLPARKGAFYLSYENYKGEPRILLKAKS
jgi:hypothetical protein